EWRQVVRRGGAWLLFQRRTVWASRLAGQRGFSFIFRGILLRSGFSFSTLKSWPRGGLDVDLKLTRSVSFEWIGSGATNKRIPKTTSKTHRPLPQAQL